MRTGYWCHFTMTWPSHPDRKSEYKCEHFAGGLGKLVRHLQIDGQPMSAEMQIDLRNNRAMRVMLPVGAQLDVVITDHPVDFATLYPEEARAAGVNQNWEIFDAQDQSLGAVHAPGAEEAVAIAKAFRDMPTAVKAKPKADHGDAAGRDDDRV